MHCRIIAGFLVITSRSISPWFAAYATVFPRPLLPTPTTANIPPFLPVPPFSVQLRRIAQNGKAQYWRLLTSSISKVQARLKIIRDNRPVGPHNALVKLAACNRISLFSRVRGAIGVANNVTAALVKARTSVNRSANHHSHAESQRRLSRSNWEPGGRDYPDRRKQVQWARTYATPMPNRMRAVFHCTG